MLTNCKFDKEKCKQGIRCLENYHREWDEVAKVFKDRPKHDWSSHSVDAFRTGGMSIKDDKPKRTVKINQNTITVIIIIDNMFILLLINKSTGCCLISLTTEKEGNIKRIINIKSKIMSDL